jgi:hypothetical protein
MSRLVALVLSASLILGSTAVAEPPQGPSKPIPELRVLDHWVGAWDVELTVKPNADVPKGMHAKGTVTAEWILQGRFLQQIGDLEPGDGSPGMQVKNLMTYDPRKKVYRSWMFFSSGLVIESEGTWDERSRRLTSTSRDAERGTTTTTQATFAEDGTESWSMISKDRTGKVVEETIGKNTRRKP